MTENVDEITDSGENDLSTFKFSMPQLEELPPLNLYGWKVPQPVYLQDKLWTKLDLGQISGMFFLSLTLPLYANTRNSPFNAIVTDDELMDWMSSGEQIKMSVEEADGKKYLARGSIIRVPKNGIVFIKPFLRLGELETKLLEFRIYHVPDGKELPPYLKKNTLLAIKPFILERNDEKYREAKEYYERKQLSDETVLEALKLPVSLPIPMATRLTNFYRQSRDHLAKRTDSTKENDQIYTQFENPAYRRC